jgi:hypothetical protein
MPRSLDIAVLLRLTLPGAAEASFQKLASDLHAASPEWARLSGLMQHDGLKRVNRSAHLGLLGHGLRYLYPAVRGRTDEGTANLFRS